MIPMVQELPRQISYGFWKGFLKDSTSKMTKSPPDRFFIECERGSLRIPYGNGPGALQTNFLLNLKGIPECFHVELDQEPCRPLAYRFSRKSIRIPKANWPGVLQTTCLLICKEVLKSKANVQELTRPIFYWFWKAFLMESKDKMTKSNPKKTYWLWKEFLEDSIWKLTKSTPDKFPIDSERTSLRLPCGNGPGTLWTNFLLLLKGLP